MMKQIIILGAGGHAKVVADCIDKGLYDIKGFLDKDGTRKGEIVCGYPILGSDSNPTYWFDKGITSCICGIGHLGNFIVRNKVYRKFKETGFEMVSIIHASAKISPYAHISAGTVIMPNAVVNSCAYIGENSIVNTGAIVEHDVKIEKGVHLAPGSVVSGGSLIKENTFIGAGSIVIQGIEIGRNCVVGAGSIVIRNIPDGTKAVGNPGRIIREA